MRVLPQALEIIFEVRRKTIPSSCFKVKVLPIKYNPLQLGTFILIMKNKQEEK